MILPMNKLPIAKRVQILSMLCEGSSMRSITRVADVSLNTVTKLLIDAGKACDAYHDTQVRGVKARRVQCDEIWSFIGVKAKNRAASKRSADPTAGDVWTWTALESDTKLIVSYLVGGRDAEYALAMMDDLRERLANRVQLTTDGHSRLPASGRGSVRRRYRLRPTREVLWRSPGIPGSGAAYSPAGVRRCHGRRTITGNPDPRHVSTSYVERQNLTMRMHHSPVHAADQRLLSKKIENHAYAVALHVTFYNFVRIHKTFEGYASNGGRGCGSALVHGGRRGFGRCPRRSAEEAWHLQTSSASAGAGFNFKL